MRILISVLAMLVVGLFATQAKADLVDDLRSGRSDIKAADASAKSNIDYYRQHKEHRSWRGHTAMAVKWREPWGSSISYGHKTMEAAVRAAVSKCERAYGGKCAGFSVGDQVVVGFSKRELAATITAKSNYCKKLDGTVYKNSRGLCGVKNITKAEYDRLKGKKTATASKSTRSADNIVYCRSPSGNVYRSDPEGCRRYTKITKAEYDRLKRKTATASESTTSSGYRELFCQKKYGTRTAQKFGPIAEMSQPPQPANVQQMPVRSPKLNMTA